MPNLTGQFLGRYHILAKLGEGGMAIVYKARDTRLGREVALKVIRTEKLTLETMEKTIKRFQREARALAKLEHPNIVPILDFGEHEGKPFLVMPYILGGTLKERIGRPIPWKEAARLLIPIARGLEYAHQQRIVHRDVKPSNILLDPSGIALLTDFGIAKILSDTEETSELTTNGMGIGTPEYMSPEQFQGSGVDERTDIYSLGVIFYEMVTGKKPYTAKTPGAIMLKQAMEPLPRPSTFVSGIPSSVEKALLKALTKNPADRFANMAEFLRALEAISQGKEIPVIELTGTVTVDKSYDTFDTYQVKEPTYSTVDQNYEQRTITQSQSLPARPQRTSNLIHWVLGGIGICVVGILAIAFFSSAVMGNASSGTQTNYQEPSSYQNPTNNVAPTSAPETNESATTAPINTVVPTAISSPVSPVSARKTTEFQLSSVESIWIYSDIGNPGDIPSPGGKSFTITVNSSVTLRWLYYWCTSDSATLKNNLNYMTVTFLINDVPLGNNKIYQYNQVDGDWRCKYWSTTLSDWQNSATIQLNIHYSFSKTVNDGHTNYPAGDYYLRLNVNVR